MRATLVTTFEAADPAEVQLNSLSLWLDQTQFEGCEEVDYRFQYSTDGSIECRAPGGLPEARLVALAAAIDEALGRIASDMEPKTRRAALQPV
jgi:hypothetical protein